MNATDHGIRYFLTAQGGVCHLSEQPPLAATVGMHDLLRVWVDATRRFQTLEGFCGAFTDAAAVTWQRLNPASQQQVLHDCFHPDTDHGYTLCRVPMNSCDFALGNYAHIEMPGDVDLRGFNIDRDRQALMPFIRAAQRAAGQPLKLLVSPWSPPAWLKSNGRMDHGGDAATAIRRRLGAMFVRNLCSAPILADRASGALPHQSSYWAIGHFARSSAPARNGCCTRRRSRRCCAPPSPTQVACWWRWS